MRKNIGYTKAHQSRRANKYNAQRVESSNGSYPSKLHQTIHEQLLWRQKAGEIKEIIPEYKVEWYVNEVKIQGHLIDYKCIMADDSIEFYEPKGVETDRFKVNKQFIIAQLGVMYPGCRYFLCKGNWRQPIIKELTLKRVWND